MLEILLQNLLPMSSQAIENMLIRHSYLSLFVLMSMESASLPIPTEIVLPVVGSLVASGQINLLGAFLIALLGSMVGMSIDYSVAYFLGKQVAYKKLKVLHIRKEQIESFQEWFNRNGNFAVFIARLLPVVRGLISFSAGFAHMPIGQFYFFSLAGTALWDVLMIGFGYFALSSNSLVNIIIGIAALGLAMQLLYKYYNTKIRKK